MATNGTRGADFERATRKHLEECGYVVVRSAASKTGIDLVALHSGLRTPFWPQPPTMLVQCKTNGRLDPGEWNALWSLAQYSGTYAVLARREWAGRRAVVALYELTGPKVPNSRKPPMARVLIPEVAGAEAV